MINEKKLKEFLWNYGMGSVSCETKHENMEKLLDEIFGDDEK